MLSDDVAFALALAVLGVASRCVAGALLAGEPVWDGHYYDFGAKRIAGGYGYSDDVTIAGALVRHPWCHYPVGYSAWLAAFYAVLGQGPRVLAFANAVASGLLPAATFALARTALSPARARLAGLVVLLHPGLVLYGALTMSEPLAALTTLGAFLVYARAPQPKRALVLGAMALGVSALVRPQALLCAPLFVVARGDVRAAFGGRAKGLVVAAAVACAALLAPVLPWTARNCAVMDGCALVSTNGGWNLAIGASPRATGRFEALRAEDGCRVVTGQVQQDRCWLAYGLARIREAPGRWLALVPKKLGYTFDHESFAVEYLHEARPEAWPEPRRAAARDVLGGVHQLLACAAALAGVALAQRASRRATIAQGGLLAGLALLAYVGLAREPASVWPVLLAGTALVGLPLPGRPGAPPAVALAAALVVTTALTHAVFFGEDRYHVVATPALALLAAAALRPPLRPRPRPPAATS